MVFEHLTNFIQKKKPKPGKQQQKFTSNQSIKQPKFKLFRTKTKTKTVYEQKRNK